MIEVNYNDYKRILEENMRLIPENHKLKEEIERLNNFINKAIEYINNNFCIENCIDLKELIEILGSDKE